jgi:hypothetical protein
LPQAAQQVLSQMNCTTCFGSISEISGAGQRELAVSTGMKHLAVTGATTTI